MYATSTRKVHTDKHIVTKKQSSIIKNFTEFHQSFFDSFEKITRLYRTKKGHRQGDGRKWKISTIQHLQVKISVLSIQCSGFGSGIIMVLHCSVARK
mmetsp:Transcript_14061/g.34301  ORF Transcript_14061/g.34301 Transcript_14061/m.34301 type:complete len:97 (+) Transcript_14061:130-420(+)